MPTTLDLYLLRRFLHIFVILFLSMYGLYVIIDGFTNIDDFQEGQKNALATIQSMAAFYFFQTSLFFDLIGSIIAVTAVMVVFALLHKHCEVLPVLAAGIPARRLLWPVTGGVLLVTLGVILNQELVLPRIAQHLEAPRGAKDTGDKEAEPVYDFRTHILISGKEMYLTDRRMTQAKFVLPVRDVAADLTTLKAAEATYFAKSSDRAAGWLLKGISPTLAHIQLTEPGREIVLATERADEAYIVTDVGFDQLYSKNSSYKYLSTLDLIQRIRNPTFDVISVKQQVMHLHTRLVRPFVNISCIFAAVPLIIRRESRSLLISFAMCAGVMGALLGLLQLCQYLGQANLIPADLAAWAPVIACSAVAGWVYGYMQT